MDRLDGQPVGEHGMVPHLMQCARRELQTGRHLDAHHAAAHLVCGAAVTRIGERLELVDGEEVADPITELLGYVAGVVAEHFGRVTVLKAALILQGLQRVKVPERRERRDAGRDQQHPGSESCAVATPIHPAEQNSIS